MPPASQSINADTLQQLSDRFKELVPQIAAAAVGLDAMAASLDRVGRTGVGLSGVFKKVDETITKMGETARKVFAGLTAAVLGTTAVADPAAFQRFTLAMRDLAGVIGSALVPVLNVLTDVIRAVADWFVNLPGWVQTAIAVVVGLALAFAAVGIVLASMVTVVKALAAAFTMLWAAMGPIGWIILAISALVALLVYLLGLLGRTDKARSSIGAGGRKVDFMSGEELQRRTMAAALKMPGAGGDPTKVAEGQRAAMIQLLQELKEKRERTGFDKDRERNT